MSTSATPASPLFDPAEVSRALALLHPAGHTFEVRVPDARLVTYNGRPDPYTATAFGYFDSPEAVLAVLPALERAEWSAVYFTLNPVEPALLARAANRLRPAKKKDSSTPDKWVSRRTAILLDADFKRPAGVSTTLEEHEAALERVREIRWLLSELGFPEPIVADSGNGGHLLYRTDLPGEDGGRVKDFIDAVGCAFDDERVGLDRSVFSAGQIDKLYGSMARKGDNTPDRPHRMSRILSAPEPWETVSEDLIRRTTATILKNLKDPNEAPPPAPAKSPAPSTSSKKTTFDFSAFMGRHFPDAKEETWHSGTRWILDHCPFNEEHKGSSAAILRTSAGKILFSCKHDGCVGRVWRDVREMFEPKATRTAPSSTGQTNAKPGETKNEGEGELRPVRIADVILEQYDEGAWIVPYLLAFGALGILSADYGLGKSTLLAQFLACVAAGREFLGYPVARAVGCLYWQAEGSRRLFAGRLRDQCRHLGLDLDNLNLSFQPRGLDPLPFDSRDFAEFVTGSGCELVVCDTFGYFTDGDENSAKDWKQKVAKPLKAIGRATGLSFFLVHHEGKPNEFRKGRHKIRGSSAMGGDSDTVLRLERIAGDPNGRLLLFDKVKDAPEQPDLTLSFDKTKGLFTREGTGQATDEAWEKRRKQIADMKVKIHKNLATHPSISGRQLFKLTLGSKGIFDAALGELNRDSLVIGEPGPKDSILWKNALASAAGRGVE